MRYLPHTENDISVMLDAVKKETLEDLFTVIPENCKRKDLLALPGALTEWELDSLMKTRAGANASPTEYTVFLGAGSYNHFIPETVSYLIGRSEFATSYTPYQPEVSQGTLQAIYEYQTFAAMLTGMDLSNASLYDGATALAEACLMALRISKKNTIAISTLIHPHYRHVVNTYLEPTDCEVIEIPMLESGCTDFSVISGERELAAVVVQSPNFFGCIENIEELSEICRKGDSLLISSFTEPLAYGLFKTPGEQGADIVCGEGQSLGIPVSFGGPGLGIFTTRSKYVRSMPGRLVGKTKDKNGRRGFVLTLATREQHIRRGRATSNICTNSSLCALAATIYMSSLGKTGFRNLAKINYDKSEYLKKKLTDKGYDIPFAAPAFNEFVVKCPDGFRHTYDELLKKHIVAGLPLAKYYPELTEHYLFCVTETSSKESMDAFLKEIP
ncbi:MAG: aminomethyl-transferring glycine dehydrogenase subunit GcvPA [Syntrophales bacterium]|jgi:glycine dehydrogenase subunit 1|nr:aminomethyl-transferring glycine dehydrogenase subunit GcvPA [Syntrophales bacterium]MDY0045466.1 aminomethyl-transferring glycine dehydrogenase subunit GcvPA [Syntrophales bacterium]